MFKLYANKFPDDYYRVYYSSEWTATLLRARKGDRKAIKHLVRLAEKSFLVERFSLLIKDLETVSDKIIIAYFDAYLNSDLKWTPFKEPEYVAAYSAKALRRLVVDFPVFENYNSIDNILKCREWMKEHKGKIVLIK